MHAPSVDLVVRDEMLSRPTVQTPDLSFGELRQLFRNDHLHMALLVENGRLLAAVERSDLDHSCPDDGSVRSLGIPEGRTVGPDAPLGGVAETMRRDGRRRLAVVDDLGGLLGLLCLKSDGSGFCSDRSVKCRRGA